MELALACMDMWFEDPGHFVTSRIHSHPITLKDSASGDATCECRGKIKYSSHADRIKGKHQYVK